MLKNLEDLRNNKIVVLVVMFLLIGAIVWLLDMVHGYSLFETFKSRGEGWWTGRSAHEICQGEELEGPMAVYNGRCLDAVLFTYEQEYFPRNVGSGDLLYPGH